MKTVNIDSAPLKSAFIPLKDSLQIFLSSVTMPLWSVVLFEPGILHCVRMIHADTGMSADHMQ